MIMRMLPILLAVSLAANVFLGGFVAGRLLGDPPHHRLAIMREGGHAPIPFFGAADALSPEGRRVFHDTFSGKRRDMRAAFVETQRLRQALAEALAAEPFDRARAEAALTAVQSSDAANQRAVVALVLDAAERLSPEDRKALASAHERRHEGRRRRLRDFNGEAGPPAEGASPPPSEPPTD